MRHITLLLAFAALAATSCSLQLDSQYGLRWEPKTHAGPSSERNQKSSSPPETVLTETAAPSWNSIEPESSEALQTSEGEDNAFGYEDAELARDPNMETSVDDEPQFEPQFFMSEQEDSVVLDAIDEYNFIKPTRLLAIFFAILMILAGLIGLFWFVVGVVLTVSWYFPWILIFITLTIFALTILCFWLAVKLINIAKSTNGRSEL
jgi:hypothetical protein